MIALAALAATGCYSTFEPACGFLCGTGGACPDDYTCATDSVCHRNGSPADLVCYADAAAGGEPRPIDGSGGSGSAGSDAGPIDAKPIDAKEIDAKPIDAKAIDAKAIDATPIDAPPIDAPPIDAPPIDAAGSGSGSDAGVAGATPDSPTSQASPRRWAQQSAGPIRRALLAPSPRRADR
jgi:hypothetical protein|nr:hypothetical protein [Kofleriaceae bacterium]